MTQSSSHWKTSCANAAGEGIALQPCQQGGAAAMREFAWLAVDVQGSRRGVEGVVVIRWLGD